MITTIIVLAIVGILAVLFEMVLPGGILGIGGAICLAVVVILCFVEYGSTWGLISLAILIAFGFVMTWAWMKFFHRLPFTRTLILKGEVGEDDELKERQTIVGKIGEALTDIRPSGRAKINGERMDVMSESGVIEKGAEIEVVETRGPSIIVREATRG